MQPMQRTFQTIYNPAFLEQQRLQRRVRQQKQQRTAAFFLGLLTVTGTCKGA